MEFLEIFITKHFPNVLNWCLFWHYVTHQTPPEIMSRYPVHHLLQYEQIKSKFCESPSPRFDTLRPRQNGRHFADKIFKCIFLNENVWISLTISLKCVPKVRIKNIPALVQIMAWRQPGGKPWSEPMMVNLLTHICVTQLQWVKHVLPSIDGHYWDNILLLYL